jgi:hypothetical protein
MTSMLQHCPAIPMTGTRLGTVIPHMQAFIGDALDRCITDAGYRGHNACPITSSRSTPPGQKRRVTPQIKREFKRRAPSSPSSATSREHHRMGRNHLAKPFSPPATTFAATRVVDVFVAWNPDRAWPSRSA